MLITKTQLKYELEFLDGLQKFFAAPENGVKITINQTKDRMRQAEVNEGTACGCFGAWISYDMQLGWDP